MSTYLSVFSLIFIFKFQLILEVVRRNKFFFFNVRNKYLNWLLRLRSSYNGLGRGYERIKIPTCYNEIF